MKFKDGHRTISKRISYIFIFLFLMSFQVANATHNRAGEITYKQIGPLSIRMTITTYTKTSSAGADRDSLEIFWGDGSSQFVQRTGNGTPLPNDVKKNEYTAEHTYPGRGTFTIYFLDPNRVGNILNVNYPNSIDIPFFLSTTFTLLNSQFQGLNNSAILLQPPIDIACIGQPFRHNPNAFDIDGDSLAYELVEPLMDENTPVSNYKYPDEILPGINNIAYINPITGDFIWENPPQEGEYNIAIKVKEYRKGFLINSIIRDMQIKIVKCNNDPPSIDAEKEICLIAGDSLELDIEVTDPDTGQKVMLTATGGPFSVLNNQATLDSSNQYFDVPFKGKFKWKTTCDHVKKEYYQVVFRAVDNYFGDTTGLATFHTLRIKVVAPPPENLMANAISQSIHLEWDLPYLCEETDNNFFQGFSIWRKVSPNPFEIDTCNTGLDNKGYEEIVFLTKQNDGEKYFYIDENLEKGITYCYRIQAEFSLLTPSGSLFNRVESLPSNEICLQISRDIPLITKVSVDSTSITDGIVHVRWTKPLIDQLDTIENPGPYKVTLARRLINEGTYNPINSSEVMFDDFNESIDTNYFDQNLNTTANQYEYQAIFYTNGNFNQPYGESSSASSLKLSLLPSDKRITLSWSDQTPWSNFNFDVYRQNTSGNWDFLTNTEEDNYTDLNLINNREYCYYIDATGSYALDDIEDPIENSSQIACVKPVDDVPPCAPNLEVTNVCEEIEYIGSPEELINTLRWTDANQFCDRIEVIDFYTIYYKPTVDAEFNVLAIKQGTQTLIYDHLATSNGLAGCYMVTATDTLGNESEPSNIVCKENCPLFSLPNTFTPDGDGHNDIFVPTRNVFIARIDLKVFNEWGNLVFETAEPSINWNGKKNGNGKALNAGTYYYTCQVFAESSEGEIELTPQLHGFINIIK